MEAGPAHLEMESAAAVVCSLDPAGIMRGETETKQGFRGGDTGVTGVTGVTEVTGVTGVTGVPPW